MRPERIVSLCPSITETIFELGAGDRLVGITEWCVHPHGDVDDVPKVGGTKTPDVDAILASKPDLVVMNEEENRIQDKEAFEAAGLQVLNTFPKTVQESAQMIRSVAEAIDCEEEAQAMVSELEEALREAREATEGSGDPLRVVYLIWRGPLMAAGPDTYIDDLLRIGGAVNVFGDREERYPHLTDDELKNAGMDMVLLCSEPFPFTAQYAAEIRSLCSLKSKHVPIVDGEYFSWYGARTAEGVRYATRKVRKLKQIRDAARAGA